MRGRQSELEQRIEGRLAEVAARGAVGDHLRLEVDQLRDEMRAPLTAASGSLVALDVARIRKLL